VGAEHLTNAIYGSTQAAVSSVLLLVFFGLCVALLRTWRASRRPSVFIVLSWALHGVVYYTAVLGLRVAGFEVGDAGVTETVTLWSSALRVHAAITLYLVMVAHSEERARVR